MKPPIPTEIGVDGVKVRVRLMKSSLGKQPGGYSVPGDYGKNLIRIDQHSTRQGLAQTLLGELLHHLWERVGLSRFYTKKQEEHIIHELDSWLLTTLEENPDLVEFLSAGPG